jgi:hypothetical protein
VARGSVEGRRNGDEGYGRRGGKRNANAGHCARIKLVLKVWCEKGGIVSLYVRRCT